MGANLSDHLSDSDRDTLLIQQVLRAKVTCRDRGHLLTPTAKAPVAPVPVQYTGTAADEGSSGIVSDDDLCGADKVIYVCFTTLHLYPQHLNITQRNATQYNTHVNLSLHSCSCSLSSLFVCNPDAASVSTRHA